MYRILRIGMVTMVLACMSAGAGRAQEKQPTLVVPSDSPRKMLHTFLLREAQKHFDARRADIAALKTPDDIHKRQTLLKGKFLEALGGFPDKTPLNAKVVGTAQRDGYRIEKLIYESRPNHHVTATLYLPDSKTSVPGVIMPIGHSSNGKAADYIQRGCILLAKNGIAALTYDPIGQGERRQLLDPQGLAAISNSTNEHTLIGVGAILVGQGTATYRIWDGIRSLDYLASRPEIDPKRLGCTGCSGGGTLTSYLMALDDRIAAAAPSCYITSLERLFATIGPQDGEQNITGQVAFGMEHADFLTMRAPRPTLICAASRDFFDIQGTWTSFREATLLYGMLGHSERMNLVEYNTAHGYPKPQREAVVRFMRRWLLDKDDAPTEPMLTIAKDADLLCTRTGQVLEDLKGKSVFNLIADRSAEFAKARDARPTPADATMRETIARTIGLPTKIPAARLLPSAEKQSTSRVYVTEPGIEVRGTYYAAAEKKPGAPLIVYVHGLGRAADAGGPIEQLVQSTGDVLALDLRGLGETSPSAPNTKPGAKPGHFGYDYKEAFLALHINRPLLGQRTLDLLAVIEHLKTDPATAQRPIHVVGIGTAGPIVLHAAALDSRIAKVDVHHSLISWEAVTRSPINFNQLTNVVPNVLNIYDLPDLARWIAPRPLTIRQAVDPRHDPVSLETATAAYATARRTYAAQKASDRLTILAK